MAPARRLAWLRAGAILVFAGAAGPALSQTASLHHRPKPVAPSAARTPDDNVTGDAASPSPTAPRPGSPRVQVRPPLLPDPILRSAVHSRYSRTPVIAATTSGQCRAQCAEARTRCDGGQGDLSDCDPAWTRCLSGCSGLNYARGP